MHWHCFEDRLTQNCFHKRSQPLSAQVGQEYYSLFFEVVSRDKNREEITMLDKKSVLFWNEVECDLYEEDGYVFGVELDLFNNQKTYYCKIVTKPSFYSDYERVEYLDLADDIYKAIDQFNEILKGREECK